jgi:hypothetical protein
MFGYIKFMVAILIILFTDELLPAITDQQLMMVAILLAGAIANSEE